MCGVYDQVARFRDSDGNDAYDVTVRLLDAHRSDLSVISRLYVSRDSLSTNPATGAPAQVGLAPGGGLVRLDNLVQIQRVPTASRIDRTDRQREVRLRAAVTVGFGQADRLDALKAEVAAMNLPLGYS